MGQRSQIYIHFNVGDNEGMVARYFQWNYGERMISRARSIMEFLDRDYNLLLGEHDNSKEKEGYTDYEAE